MKTKHWTTPALLIALLALLAPLPVLGDDHDEYDEEIEHEEEIPFPSEEETLTFLKKEVPVALEILEHIREEEGEEEREAVFEEFREQHYEYLEIRHHDGEEAAGLALTGARLELEMDKALHLYFSSEEESDERGELEGQVRDLLRKQWEHALEVARMELRLIEEHRDEVQAELKELEAIDEAELDAEAAELLELDEGEEDEDDEWEDDEDEDDDHEEFDEDEDDEEDDEEEDEEI